MKKLFSILIIVLSVIALLLVGIVLFVNLNPRFGGSYSDEKAEAYSRAADFRDGIFYNASDMQMDMTFTKGLSVMRDFMTAKNREPGHPIPAQPYPVKEIHANDGKPDQLVWLGHSAVFMRLNGKAILVDPMMGEKPSPIKWFGSKRFNPQLPFEAEDLPYVDIILLTHDHYDHLDHSSVLKLKEKTKTFLVPLGVAAHLEKWGVDSHKIREFAWWQGTTIDDIKMTFAPAQHFSGRGLNNRFSTLWGSWIIQTKNRNIYFSGDSGYANHFKEIGEKFGPFDFAMLECGQYDDRWKDVHMMPEETFLAAKDLGAQTLMPIHWGAFTLAVHPWDDPPKRLVKASDESNAQPLIPEIGQPVIFDNLPETQKWWQQ